MYMATRSTNLTTSGNYIAVRLPKDLLRISGLNSGIKVKLEVERGKIIISKCGNPRTGWDKRIKAMVEKYGDPSEEFTALDALTDDGLDKLTWNEPTYEEWVKSNLKLS
jgi:antitoxin component of MazEF toxin-antitoxin module